MKKIFIILSVLGIAVMAACKKDKLATVSQNITAPVIKSPSADTAIVVTPADSSNILKIMWSPANYGVQGINTYFVQADSVGKNFSKFVTLGTVTAADTLSLSVGSLNSQLLAGLGLTANGATTVELRVGAALYGKDTIYSKTVKIALTTFKALAPPYLWLPGSYQGYNPATAPTIPEQTTYTYQGYAYFSAPGNFKFTSAADYNHINYGDGGNGTLTTNGNASGIVFNSAGVYYLNADIQGLTYSAVYIQSFGIIGPATAGGWNTSTPMNYDQSTGLWSITTTLIGGQPLKFRANDAWDINYGPADSNALVGTLQFNNPGSITIVNSGTYTITIDMTQKTQKAYLYSIVAQ
jgi:starch-binding outer membrane protein SusE/F